VETLSTGGLLCAERELVAPGKREASSRDRVLTLLGEKKSARRTPGSGRLKLLVPSRQKKRLLAPKKGKVSWPEGGGLGGGGFAGE